MYQFGCTSLPHNFPEILEKTLIRIFLVQYNVQYTKPLLKHNLDKTMRLFNLPVLVLEVLFRERCLRENLNTPATNR